MKTSPLAWGLLAVGLGSILGCGVTLAELKKRNPSAATLQVHCHPWKIPEHVKLFAARSSGEHVHTDEAPGALRDFAEHASVFIEVNASAPKENARIMASEYGLVCSEYLEVRSTPLEALREEKPCSMQASALASRQLMGDTNKQPCATPNGQSPPPKNSPKRIHVCVKPKWIKADLKEWALFNTKDKNGSTEDRAKFDADTTQADVIFVLDDSAPPETAYYFTKDAKSLSCAKKPAKTFDQVVQGNTMPDLVDLNATMKSMEDKATGKTGKTTQTAATTPKTGSSPPSATSSPNGQGPALSIFEQFANGMIVAGSLAQGNTSGSLNQADGHRNGMPGGQNVGGISFPLLQAGVATFQILNGVGVSVSPKKFFQSIVEASKKGQRTVIEKADKAALDFADDLIKNHGQYQMAKGLEEMQTIMPYAMGEKFTQGLGGKFQAHKIFEKQALEKLTGRKDFEKLPSVILTKEEHKEVTNLLNAAWKKYGPKEGEQLTVNQLRQIYKKAYEGHPHWLEIIEKQIRKL